ncbi:MAG: response regulator [bacterium]|nr:response regulator [bacterium]
MNAPKRVIYVEDDEFFGKTISGLLSAAGYEVHLVSDGEAGLVAIRSQKPDLVLLDLLLPKLDGKEVLRQLKADPETKSIPVFVLSNLSAEKDVEETRALGAKTFFVKAQTLPTAVAKAVEETLAH